MDNQFRIRTIEAWQSKDLYSAQQSGSTYCNPTVTAKNVATRTRYQAIRLCGDG
jgi:hypothetical protein